MTKKGNAQAGSIFTMILIFIALFAALSYALTQGFRGGSATGLSEQQAKLAASEIIQYGSQLREAIKALRINGCNDSQISFESSATGTDYFNPSSPPDNHCKVFHPNGGGMNHPSALLNELGNWRVNFAGRTDLDGIGRSNCGDISCSDLYMYLRSPTILTNGKMICEQYNKLLGHTDLSPIPSMDYAFAGPNFIGTYGAYHYSSRPQYTGKHAGCYNYSSVNTQYHFYYVLLAR